MPTNRKHWYNQYHYWFDFVILLGFLVLHGLVFAVTNWNMETSLLGVKSAHFGRYYSAKTIHAYQLGLDPFRVPEYWNSIGETIPFEEENLIQNTPVPQTLQSFFIDNKFIQTMGVFINTNQTIEQDAELSTCNYILNGRGLPSTVSAGQPSIRGVHPKCSLEHLHNVRLVTNGNSASILSEVTPSVYFTTLLIIYLLSMVQWVSVGIPRLVTDLPISCLKALSSDKHIRQASYVLRVILYGFIIVWYSVMMLYAFTGINSMNYSHILKSKDAKNQEFMYNVYFRVVSHLPSLMVNLFAILLYALHLRGRHLAFGYYWGKYQPVEGKPPEYDPDHNWNETTIPEVATENLSQSMLGFPMTTLNLHMPQMHQSMHTGMMRTGVGGDLMNNHVHDGWHNKDWYKFKSNDPHPFFNNRKPDQPESESGLKVGCFDRVRTITENTLACTNYRSLGALEEWSTQHRTGTKYHGPVTSEASVLLAFTVVLGGIGCAAIGKGMTLEIELQMLLIAVVSFAVLEIGIQKVHNYYIYVAQFHDEIEKEWGRTFFVAFTIVRLVVLVLQGIILTLWMNTMDNIGSSSQTLFTFIFVMTVLYYCFRLFILMLEIVEQSLIASMKYPGNKLTPEQEPIRQKWRFVIEMTHFVVEFVWGVFLFIIIISVIYSMTRGNLQDSNEAMVLRYDKKLYGHMRGELQKDVEVNDACGSNFQDTSLLAKQMSPHNFEENNQMKDIKNIEALYLKPNGGGMFSANMTAIDLKTYYWSRRWRQGSMSMGPLKTPGTVNTDIFFCSAGFERHWGICQNYYTENSLPEDVSKEIMSEMRYYETSATNDPANPGKTLIKRTEWNDGVEVVPPPPPPPGTGSPL